MYSSSTFFFLKKQSHTISVNNNVWPIVPELYDQCDFFGGRSLKRLAVKKIKIYKLFSGFFRG